MQRTLGGIVLLALGATSCAEPGPVWDVGAQGYVGGVFATVVVYGLGVAGVLALAITMLVYALRWSRRANAADRAVAGACVLREGPIVLAGHVAPGSDPAVRVEIEQRAEEWRDDSGNWSHLWAEKQRRIRVRPFELVLTTGERVRVEPATDVCLADALDGVVRIDRTARLLVAELTPMEPVIAVGHLTRRPVPDGYRGTADRWVLVAPSSARDPMILSTEPLGERFRRRANGAFIAASLTLIGAVALHAASLGYHLRTLAGITVVGAYVSHRNWTTRDSEGDERHHHLLAVRLPNGAVHEERIGETARLSDAYVRWVPSQPWATSFGRTPEIVWLLVVAYLGLPLVMLVLLAWLTRASWYEGARQSSGGSGRVTL